MFEPKERIFYGNSGICEVVSVGPIADRGTAAGRLYYRLQPLYGSEVIFAPVDTTVYMRPAMTREQALALIAQIPAIPGKICELRNQQELRQHYERPFQSHESKDLVGLIKSIYAKTLWTTEQGRKTGQLEQRYMKRAVDLLHGELAAALGIDRETVPAFIADAATADAAE